MSRNGLPDGWALSTLGEIGQYLNGRAFKSHEWSDRGRMIVRIQDLTGSGNAPNFFDGDVERRYEIRAGDLLISWAATLGAYIWHGPDAILNQHIFKVESFIDQRFHFYLVTAALDELRRQAHGSGMIHITKGRFDATAIALPPLTEQRRIVSALEEHLSELDAAVAGLERARANAVRLRESVIANLIVGREAANAPADSCEPGKWEWHELRALGALRGGITKGQRRRDDDTLRAVPYLRVANVQRGYLDLSDMKTIEATEEEIAELRLEHGDVLFNEGGDRDKLGRGWVWQGELLECIHQNHVFRLRPDARRVDSRFLSYYGNSHGQRYFLEQGKQTTNLASINLTKLGGLPVPVPPLTIQRKIVEEIDAAVSSAERAIRDIETQLLRASRLRQAILKHAFEGKLVPQDPNDEPASVLLDRIRAERESSESRAPRTRTKAKSPVRPRRR